ncbi:MAG: hypothetical protein WCO13_04865 [Bacteroidota bacterium]
MKKPLIYICILLFFILSFFVYWHYYNTYSEGNRAGILQKFSKKGNLFKTYEGELILSSIASTSNTTIASEKFLFSVKEDKIANIMFTLEGKHVTLHYKEKRAHLPWNGETNYFVDSIIPNQ